MAVWYGSQGDGLALRRQVLSSSELKWPGVCSLLSECSAKYACVNVHAHVYPMCGVCIDKGGGEQSSTMLTTVSCRRMVYKCVFC